MSARVRAIVECDRCRTQREGGPNDSIVSLRSWLQANGWRVGVQAESNELRDLCGACVKARP